MKKQSAVYVFDMDEVLVDISYELYRRLKSNWSVFSKYLIDAKYTEKNIYDRSDFYIDNTMLKDNLSEEDLKEKAKYIDQLVFTADFYDTLKPSKLAVGTLMNPAFMNSKNVKEVVILTRYTTDELMESKKVFLRKYFNHSKIRVLYVPRSAKKSDFLKDNNVNWDVLVDDELSNVKDIAETFDLENREFLIPEYGYNKMPSFLSLLIEGKGGRIVYYDAREENNVLNK